MASKTDQHRQSIRERKMAAERKLKQQRKARDQLQSNAFDELDHLEKLLDAAGNSHTEDLFKRATQLTKLATELPTQLGKVTNAAQALVDDGAMTKADVADLLGTRQTSLFTRSPTTATKPAAPPIPATVAPEQSAAEDSR